MFQPTINPCEGTDTPFGKRTGPHHKCEREGIKYIN